MTKIMRALSAVLIAAGVALLILYTRFQDQSSLSLLNQPSYYQSRSYRYVLIAGIAAIALSLLGAFFAWFKSLDKKEEILPNAGYSTGDEIQTWLKGSTAETGTMPQGGAPTGTTPQYTAPQQPQYTTTQQSDMGQQQYTGQQTYGNPTYGNADPYVQNTYNQQYNANGYGQDPYNQNAYAQNPYAQNQYTQPGYGTQATPYGYAENPTGTEQTTVLPNNGYPTGTEQTTVLPNNGYPIGAEQTTVLQENEYPNGMNGDAWKEEKR